jgi:hypothetical protein
LQRFGSDCVEQREETELLIQEMGGSFISRSRFRIMKSKWFADSQSDAKNGLNVQKNVVSV